MIIKNLSELNEGYDSRDSAFINVALGAYDKAIREVDPYRVCKQYITIEGGNLLFKGRTFVLDYYTNIYVIGAGKAGYKMAKAMHDLLGNRITSGCVCVPQNSNIPEEMLGNIRFVECAHPIPDLDSVLSARMITQIASKAGANDLIICLLSGGASSLMCLPAEGLTLEDKQCVGNLLLKSGADINEINTVRKHLSGIKGGKLAKLAYPAEIIQLVISDVIGNNLETIGSGPAVSEKTTFNDAINILKRYSLWDSIPQNVVDYLNTGAFGRMTKEMESDTMNRVFDRVYTSIIADNHLAVTAAAKYLEDFEFKIYYYPKAITGEAADEAKDFFFYVAKLKKDNLDPFAVIAGGEPVVTFKKITSELIAHGGEKDETATDEDEDETASLPKGRFKSKFRSEQMAEIGEMLRQKQMKKMVLGGRSQEFAIAMLRQFEEYPNNRQMFFLAAGTDGIDGPTDAAGAIITYKTIPNAIQKAYLYKDYLARHDSYNFFNNVGGLVKTGYTGTNVNDLFIALVPPQID